MLLLQSKVAVVSDKGKGTHEVPGGLQEDERK
jgi:hypothetical protein